MTSATQLLLMHLKAEGLPAPELELQFLEDRKWRFDLAWPRHLIACEIDGGVFARQGARRCPVCKNVPQGGHNTAIGFIRNMEKLNAAAENGWLVFRFYPGMVKSGVAVRQLKRVLLEGFNEKHKHN